MDKYHLGSTSFFSFLTKNEEDYVKVHLRKIEFKKGQVIFKEDTFSKGLYIIRKGKVKIYTTNAGGKESIIFIYRKGDYFGYRPLLSNNPHPTSASALDNVTLYFIPAAVFIEILDKSPLLAQKLLIHLSEEFTVWINKTSVFWQYTLKERVALNLLILARIYSNDDSKGNTYVISLNRDDLANYIGTAKETLVRMLRVLKDDKIISAKGTKITILKPKALEALIENI